MEQLIIVPSEETYQALQKVAPTVYIPHESMSVDERLKKLGEVLGKEGSLKPYWQTSMQKWKKVRND
ncbi:hypothetical protein [Brevibacillus reuszeri]|uniref:hypothetical protein n=1 Tax=Brevibacillus reuszeri TaxID=54915 RepID=UPI003D25A0A2